MASPKIPPLSTTTIGTITFRSSFAGRASSRLNDSGVLKIRNLPAFFDPHPTNGVEEI
jgi:hypothetical protein